MPLFGVEVSKYNGNIDYNSVKNAGARFVIVSTSVGMREDTRASQNANGFLRVGMPIGACHTLAATNVHDTIKEAHFFADIIMQYREKYTLPPICCIDPIRISQHLSRIFTECLKDAGFDICAISDGTNTYLGGENMLHTHTRHGQLVGVIGEYACAFGYSPVSRRIIKSRTDITDDVLDYIERYERGEYVLARLADMIVAHSINPLKNPSYERIVPLIRLCCKLSVEDIAHICTCPNAQEIMYELYCAMLK